MECLTEDFCSTRLPYSRLCFERKARLSVVMGRGKKDVVGNKGADRYSYMLSITSFVYSP